MFHPTISPHDANTVLVACDMTGAYITHDAGRSWRMFNLRGVVHFFAFDPVERNTIYAGATGLWRSSDGGETWRLVYPKPSAIRAIRMNSDHAEEEILADPDPLGSITALAIDSSDSRKLYVAAGNKQQRAFFASNNGGESWERRATLSEPPLRMWVDPFSHRIYAAAKHSIAALTGTAVTVEKSPANASFIDVSAGFAANAQPTFYGITKRSAFVSHDAGSTWQQCQLPGNGGDFRAVATSLRHPKVAYLSYSELAIDARPWLGVAKTVDSGAHWSLVWKDGDVLDPHVHDAWIAPLLGPGWGGNPFALGVAEQNPEICYGTDDGRTMQTVDGGRSWNAVYSRRVPNGAWTSTGLDVTTNYGIHFDPFDRNRQFITYTDIGLFRSEDGGRSWQSSIKGVPREWRNTTYWIEFDPVVKNRMWSVNSYTHDLPRPKMWRQASPDSYRGGVCRSDDGGRTWIRSSEGMPETAATHILLDPTSRPASRTLYVAAFGRGVYKSTDGGKTWHVKNSGIAGPQPFTWRLARRENGTLFLVVARRSEDTPGALYRSDDGAETWRPVSLPQGVTGPNGLTVDPHSQRLYLAAWARPAGMHGEGGGIYLSDDDGASWRHILHRDQHIYDVTIDPHNPDILYAAGFESSAWRSTDRGEHWSRIPGFNFKWGHRVIPDPADANKIYVTTFGGSVWHGAVNGRPAILDIATPELH